MTATEHPLFAQPGTTEAAQGYAPIADRLTRRPFDPQVYSPDLRIREVAPMDLRGFPRSAGPIRPWVPGVSTPEGIMLTSSAALLAGEAFAYGGEMLVRVVHVATSTVLAGVIVGIPAGAVYVGTHLLSGH